MKNNREELSKILEKRGYKNEDLINEIEQIYNKQQLPIQGVGCSLPSKEEYEQAKEHFYNKIATNKNAVKKRYFGLGFHFAYKFVTNFIMK